MKAEKILIPIISILIAALITVAIPTEEEYYIYEDTVRLHILPNSNETIDQEMKLFIRDRLLEKYSDEMLLASTKEDAQALLGELLPSINESVNGWLREQNAPYCASVSFREEWFETRYYDGFTLPAGYYSSMVVQLGNAEGSNWWCVMYPPMCLDIATEATYTPAEYELIRRGNTSYRFKILELIAREFR